MPAPHALCPGLLLQGLDTKALTAKLRQLMGAAAAPERLACRQLVAEDEKRHTQETVRSGL